MFSERSQSKNGTYCMSPTLRYSVKGKSTETVKRSTVARGSGEDKGWIGGKQNLGGL